MDDHKSEIRDKPEWMSIQDWGIVETLPVAMRENAISLRKKMLEEGGDEARSQAEIIRNEVGKSVGPEQTQLGTWCGYPTDMTRCSPFFPMNAKELGQRVYLENYLITSAGWGQIHYTGPKLSTYDEDVLMILLSIMNDVSPNRFLTEKEGRKTYTYTGPALPLLRILGTDRPGKANYKRLISALERLAVAGVKICISAGKTKGGKPREPRISQMSAMLAGVYWDEDKKELSVTVNPFFYETYYAGTVTLIEITKRVALKGVIAKALYRFVQSHQKDVVFEGHCLTLADALNMDRNQPTSETRRQLKRAITELISHQILTSKSKFLNQDIVRLERTKTALPLPKKKEKKL